MFEMKNYSEECIDDLKVTTLEELKDLMIVDLLKRRMPLELRSTSEMSGTLLSDLQFWLNLWTSMKISEDSKRKLLDKTIMHPSRAYLEERIHILNLKGQVLNLSHIFIKSRLTDKTLLGNTNLTR